MTGTEDPSSDAGEVRTAPTTRGIEPPTSGYGPPPTPDFGVDPQRWTDSASTVGVDSAEPAWGPAPPAASRSWGLTLLLAAIAAVLVVVLGLVVVGISIVPNLIGSPPETRSSDTDDAGQSDPGLIGGGSSAEAVEASLQATLNEYKAARDSGALWNTIPDTEFNRTALSAFFYLLTDLKLAASFGADTSDYLEQADELEQKLLNQEPLGSDVTIKLSDRTFTYDGETGEGGYTAN